jgi:enamine deaminase RidA (YjgF/YER057c/UK114 family)
MTSTTSKRVLQPAGVPPVPYAQGLEVTGAQRLVFVSGQVGTDEDGHWLAGIEAQARQVIGRITAILAEADLGLDDIVKLTIYLTNPADFDGFMPVAAELMPQPQSAITALVVPFLSSPEQLVEIEAIAAG